MTLSPAAFNDHVVKCIRRCKHMTKVEPRSKQHLICPQLHDLRRIASTNLTAIAPLRQLSHTSARGHHIHFCSNTEGQEAVCKMNVVKKFLHALACHTWSRTFDGIS